MTSASASSWEPAPPALPGPSIAVVQAAENLVQDLPAGALPEEGELEEATEYGQIRPSLLHSNEIDHDSHVHIRDGCSFHGPCQVIVHEMTGEVVHLEQTSEEYQWRLGFSAERGFVKSGDKKMWVNSLFKTSYWNDMRHGEDFVMQKLEAPEPGANIARQIFWLSEWQRRQSPRWLSWKEHSLGPAMSVAKVSVRQRRIGHTMFWTLSDWWSASSFSDSSPRKRRRQFAQLDTWCTTKFGLHPRHWSEVQGVGGRGNCGTEKLVSTQLLILALIHWSLTMENQVVQHQPLKLLIGLLRFSFLQCDLKLGALVRPDNPELVTHASASVSLGMFEALTDIPGVCNGWAKLDLVDVLLTLARDKDMHPTLMHIVHELACNVEDALLNSVHWETSCKKFLPAISEARGSKKMPLDPDVVHELRGMVAGSLVRTTKGLNRAVSALGLNLHAGDHYLDASQVRKLALCCRRAFSNSCSFAIAVDCKRFGGKHWLAGIFGDGITDIWTVANPVASFFPCVLFVPTIQTV